MYTTTLSRHPRPVNEFPALSRAIFRQFPALITRTAIGRIRTAAAPFPRLFPAAGRPPAASRTRRAGYPPRPAPPRRPRRLPRAPPRDAASRAASRPPRRSRGSLPD